MRKSGLSDSPFFSPSMAVEAYPATTPAAVPPVLPEKTPAKDEAAASTTAETHNDHSPDGMHDTVTPRYHDITIEPIRRAVKALGKEAATHRFTAPEKEAIAEIVYACKRQGLRTTENEITRVAVNFIVHDYQANGKDSLLVRVLLALNA